MGLLELAFPGALTLSTDRSLPSGALALIALAAPNAFRLKEVWQAQSELVEPAEGTRVTVRSRNSGLVATRESSAAFFRRLMDDLTMADVAVLANESHIACMAQDFENPSLLRKIVSTLQTSAS